MNNQWITSNTHDPIKMVTYAFRHPPRPCPVKGFPLALRDMTVDGIATYDIAISIADMARLEAVHQLAVANWIIEVLAPHMRQYGNITISKFDEELSNTEGDTSFG